MGVFASVYHHCECGGVAEWQLKDGNLNDYSTTEKIPVDRIYRLQHPESCRGCGKSYYFKAKNLVVLEEEVEPI